MKNKLFKASNKGFSLIELIVVIAIMAILVGVAVPVYTSYIGKAQKNKDIQMVDEVKHSLEIANAAGNGFVSGYIIFKADGAPEISDIAIEEYLKSVFGDDLGALELGSDEWEIKAGLLSAALSANAASVGSSSYLTNSGVSELLDNVQLVTQAAAGMLGNVTKSDDQYILGLQGALCNGDNTYYLDAAKEAGLINEAGTGFTDDVEDLETQLANLMVFSVSKELENKSSEEMQLLLLGSIGVGDNPMDNGYSSAATMTAKYALYKAFVLDNPSAADDFDAMNASLNNVSNLGDATDVLNGFLTTYEEELTAYIMSGVDDEGNAIMTDSFINNATSLSAIFDGVSSVSGGYMAADSLKSSELFTSGEVAGDLNNFVNAAAMASSLTDEQKAVLTSLTNGIVVFVGADGAISVVPQLG